MGEQILRARSPGGTVFDLVIENAQGEVGVTVLDPAAERLLTDIKHAVNDYEVRFDYTGSPDGKNPIYIGKAVDNAATTDAVWAVQRFYYDASRRVERIRVRVGISWDDRAVGW